MPEPQQKHVETALDSWWDEYAKQLSVAESHRVETFIRSLTPAAGTHGRRQQLFKTLEQQTTAETVEQYDVTVIGKELCLCEHCQMLDDSQLRETVTHLESWRDGGIRSTGFAEQETRSSITDEQYSVIVPPEIALGIYVDDSLTGVFPCVADGVTFRPETYLDGLTSGKLQE